MVGILSLLLSNLPMIFSAAPQVVNIIKVGVPIIQAWQQVSPEIVPLIKNLAGTLFPGAGDLEHGLVGALLAGHPLDAEQQKRWDDHMTGVDPATGNSLVSGG